MIDAFGQEPSDIQEIGRSIDQKFGWLVDAALLRPAGPYVLPDDSRYLSAFRIEADHQAPAGINRVVGGFVCSSVGGKVAVEILHVEDNILRRTDLPALVQSATDNPRHAALLRETDDAMSHRLRTPVDATIYRAEILADEVKQLDSVLTNVSDGVREVETFVATENRATDKRRHDLYKVVGSRGVITLAMKGGSQYLVIDESLDRPPQAPAADRLVYYVERQNDPFEQWQTVRSNPEEVRYSIDGDGNVLHVETATERSIGRIITDLVEHAELQPFNPRRAL